VGDQMTRFAIEEQGLVVHHEGDTRAEGRKRGWEVPVLTSIRSGLKAELEEAKGSAESQVGN